MADVTEESGEIDDFAIFRARSLGVESEYLVLAKAGQLRGSPRDQRDTKTSSAAAGTDTDQADPQTPSRRRHASGGRQRSLHSTRCNDDGRCDSPSSSIRENSCSPKVRRAAVPYTRSDSTKTETLETRNELFPLEEGDRLQRAHSYRSRRSPQPQLASRNLHGSDSDQTETSKFNRSRTMTMPARRKPVPGRTQRGTDSPNECSSPARRTGTTGSRSSFRVGVEAADTNGNRTPSLGDVFMDRAVLRVRNFSTKSGNIVNRGDSIKIRGVREARSGGGAEGWSTPTNGGGGTRPPSLRNENGGIGGGQHDTPLASPVRQSLSRHSSRGSYKYHASELDYATSPEGGRGGGGGGGMGGFPSSPSRSSHNLLCPLSYPLSGGGYAEENEEEEEVNKDGSGDLTASRLKVNCGEDQSTGGRQGRVTGAGRTETEEEASVYKVLVLGSQGVGKTTLTKQLLTSEYLANNENDFDDETSDKIVSVQVDDEESMLQFIDAPQTSQPTKEKDGVEANLVVYSVTDRSSFTFAQSCLQELRPAKRHNVVILVANKQDIVRNRNISEEDGKSLAAKRHCKFIEVSALLNHKTDDLLVGITRQIRLRKARTSSATHGAAGGPNDNSPDNGGPVGCLQRVAMEAFRKLFKRRPIEATSCDDLFTP